MSSTRPASGFHRQVGQAVRVADAAVICVDGKAGVEVGTELAWDIACGRASPAFFVNKCDDEECKFERVFRQLHATFGVSGLPCVHPRGDRQGRHHDRPAHHASHQVRRKGNRTETAMRIGWGAHRLRVQDALNEALAGTADELMGKVL